MKLSINQLKYINSLQKKKFRQMYDKFVVEGTKIVQEVLQDRHIGIENVYALESWLEEQENIPLDIQDKIISVDERDLKKISAFSTPNQVLAILQKPTHQCEPAIVQSKFNLYLDGIQDPGNMGTIIRIADWFGIPYIFCSNTCVEVFNPKVLQASMGAFLRVKVIEMAFSEWQVQFPELPILGTTVAGQNIFQTDLPKNGLIVIGNESKGISKQIAYNVSHQIAIPKSSTGGAESLNAAIATGIVCAVLTNPSV